MAKRRKKASKPARKRGAKRRSKGKNDDPMNVVAALLLIALVGLAYYFYAQNHKGAQLPIGPAVASLETR